MARTTPLLVLPNWSTTKVISSLARFRRTYGHFDFIDVEDDLAEILGRYSTKLREYADAGRLADTHIKRLAAMEFPMDGYEYRWQRMHQKIVHSIADRERLPHSLMTWWRRQRELRGEGALSPARLGCLNALPFTGPIAYHWDLRYQAVVALLKDEKRLSLSQSNWLASQQRSISNGNGAVLWNKRYDIPEDLEASVLRWHEYAADRGLFSARFVPLEERAQLNKKCKSARGFAGRF